MTQVQTSIPTTSSGRGRHAQEVRFYRKVHQIARFIDWFERRREYHRAILEMQGLSDRELLDIGVTRSDVRRVVTTAYNTRRPRDPELASFSAKAER
jgi:uncharacterized protein YjiS (DUF1127 family)